MQADTPQNYHPRMIMLKRALNDESLITHPTPISVSATFGEFFFNDAQGPIAPAILNSLE
jgi:hypothetical protein